MGASNAIAAYVLYSSRLPSKSMHVLNWMALVSLDKDTEPWWSQGHEVLAKMPLGRPEPITSADLRAVERAITPLFEAGAITVDRHSSGRPGNPQHVRYRLWLRQPAPDENRRVDHRSASVEKRRVPKGRTPADIGGESGQNDRPVKMTGVAPDENRRTPDASTRRKVVEHPTKSDGTPDDFRRTKEYEEYEEREEKQEEIISSSNSLPLRAPEAPDDAREIDQPAVDEAGGGAGASLPEAAKTAASGASRTSTPGYRWRDPREIAAQQAAESRGRREAAERAQAEAVAT